MKAVLGLLLMVLKVCLGESFNIHQKYKELHMMLILGSAVCGQNALQLCLVVQFQVKS